MRSEQEILDLILKIAREDERIRAVWMTGSRTNPNVAKDIFQDYDVVFAVRETKLFYENPDWVSVLGDRLYGQLPDLVDRNLGMDVDFDRGFTWLMQFRDGVRVDLRLLPVDAAGEAVLADRLCVVLLDKDGVLPPVPATTDADHWVRRPSAAAFAAVCNEFWWCLNNVAKGLWREEPTYVQEALGVCRGELLMLLNWKVGFETDFRVSTGKASKALPKYLSEDLWARLLDTYTRATVDDMRRGALVMADLFDDVARELETRWGMPYDEVEAWASFGFLKHVSALPKDAPGVY